MPMRLTRRTFLRATALTAAASLLAACQRTARASPTATPPAMARNMPEGPPPAARYRQAPMLDAAEHAPLPPVDERLPQHPLVLGAQADVGIYGGTLRRPILQTVYESTAPEYRGRALRRSGDEPRLIVDALDAHRWFLYDENLVQRPWLLESWEFDGEGAWNLYLREGLRWSDGVPFTLQDVQFAIDHGPRVVPEDAREALRATYEVVDDHLLRVHDASLDALDALADATVSYGLIAPAHYLRQLLPEFNDPERLVQRARAELQMEVSALLPAEGLLQLWQDQQTDWRRNPGLPTLNPWVLGNSPNADLFTYQRNPYCWLVDDAGDQLPYLDEIILTWTDAGGLRQALARQAPDVVDQGLGLSEYRWLEENLDRGAYDLHACPSPGHLALQLNLSTPDPAKRILLNDRRVRQAISLLTQRENLSLFHFEGLLTPRQLAPLGGGPYASDDLATCYVAHDPQEANRLLDEAGYATRDDEGYRLLPDGERIFLVLLEVSPTRTRSADAELLVECLAEGGIACGLRAVTRDELTAARGQNDWDALYSQVDLPAVATAGRLGFWCGLPRAEWCGLFRSEAGERYEQPPPDHFLWALWALHAQYETAGTEAERISLWQQAMAIWQEELPAIGILGEMPRLVVVRKGLRGLDPNALYADELGGLGGGRLALFYYAQ